MCARTTWMIAVSVHMFATASAAACCSSGSALHDAADRSRIPPLAAISSLRRSSVDNTARHCTATNCVVRNPPMLSFSASFRAPGCTPYSRARCATESTTWTTPPPPRLTGLTHLQLVHLLAHLDELLQAAQLEQRQLGVVVHAQVEADLRRQRARANGVVALQQLHHRLEPLEPQHVGAVQLGRRQVHQRRRRRHSHRFHAPLHTHATTPSPPLARLSRQPTCGVGGVSSESAPREREGRLPS